MGSQRVGHDWVTELNWTEEISLVLFEILAFTWPGTGALQGNVHPPQELPQSYLAAARTISKVKFQSALGSLVYRLIVQYDQERSSQASDELLQSLANVYSVAEAWEHV